MKSGIGSHTDEFNQFLSRCRSSYDIWWYLRHWLRFGKILNHSNLQAMKTKYRKNSRRFPRFKSKFEICALPLVKHPQAKIRKIVGLISTKKKMDRSTLINSKNSFTYKRKMLIIHQITAVDVANCTVNFKYKHVLINFNW